MSSVIFVGDGLHMCPKEEALPQFTYLMDGSQKHLAICFRGPFRDREFKGQRDPRWADYINELIKFFDPITGASGASRFRYSARMSHKVMMACFYTSAAVTRMPSSEELDEFIALLNAKFTDLVALL